MKGEHLKANRLAEKSKLHAMAAKQIKEGDIHSHAEPLTHHEPPSEKPPEKQPAHAPPIVEHEPHFTPKPKTPKTNEQPKPGIPKWEDLTPPEQHSLAAAFEQEHGLGPGSGEDNLKVIFANWEHFAQHSPENTNWVMGHLGLGEVGGEVVPKPTKIPNWEDLTLGQQNHLVDGWLEGGHPSHSLTPSTELNALLQDAQDSWESLKPEHQQFLAKELANMPKKEFPKIPKPEGMLQWHEMSAAQHVILMNAHVEEFGGKKVDAKALLDQAHTDWGFFTGSVQHWLNENVPKKPVVPAKKPIKELTTADTKHLFGTMDPHAFFAGQKVYVFTADNKIKLGTVEGHETGLPGAPARVKVQLDEGGTPKNISSFRLADKAKSDITDLGAMHKLGLNYKNLGSPQWQMSGTALQQFAQERGYELPKPPAPKPPVPGKFATPLPANVGEAAKDGSFAWMPQPSDIQPGYFLHNQADWYNKEVLQKGVKQFKDSQPIGPNYTSYGMGTTPNSAQSHDAAMRARYKDLVAGTLAQRAGVSFEKANGLLANWQQSSQGGDSTVMQFAARELFGQKLTTQLSELKKHWLASNAWEYAATAGETKFQEKVDEIKPVVQAMHDWTQEWFKERGITHLAVFRGHTYKGGQGPADGEIVKGNFHPMSSWALEDSTAHGFGDTMHYAIVPVENVIGTSWTGMGSLNEHEVILKPPLHVKAHAKYSPGGFGTSGGSSAGVLFKLEEGAAQEAFLEDTQDMPEYYFDDTPENTDWIKLANPESALREVGLSVPPDMNILEYLRDQGMQETPMYEMALRDKYRIHPEEAVETS
jgi:hypothetical protein